MARMHGAHSLNARYNVPRFVERTDFGTRENDPYSKLFDERVIFLGAALDDTSANDIAVQLLLLEEQNSERDITLYINSPGGSFTSLMGVYDTMRYVSPDISTVCLGQACSGAAIVLAAGTKGKRLILPNAKVLIHQPVVSEVIRGQISDLEVQGAEIARMRSRFEEALAEHSGRDLVQVHNDIDRDLTLSAHDAVAYGIADRVLAYRKNTQ